MLKLTENKKMRETSGSHEGDAPFFFPTGKYVVLTQWMSCSLQEQMRFFTHYRQCGCHFTTVCSHLQRHNVPLTLNIPQVLLCSGKVKPAGVARPRLCVCVCFVFVLCVFPVKRSEADETNEIAQSASVRLVHTSSCHVTFRRCAMLISQTSSR